jgi:hypothetical protein
MFPDVACLARSRPFVVRGVFFRSLKRITLSDHDCTRAIMVRSKTDDPLGF